MTGWVCLTTTSSVVGQARKSPQHDKPHYVQFSTFALSPDKRTVYEMTLYRLASRYDSDRAVLDQILKSWKYTGR